MTFGAQRLSLRGRALQALAQRDQSRVELRRKLLRHASKPAARSHSPGDAPADDRADPAEVAAAVDRVLDSLEAAGLLSNERFAESRVHARKSRFGNLRIRSELAQHGVSIDPGVAAELAATELERARDVRERRFGAPPVDAAGRAAQSRFLAQRGFSPEAIHRLMRGFDN